MQKSKKSYKAIAERTHAKRRAYERLGVHVGNETLREIVQAIQKGQAKFICRESNRVTVFEYPVHDIPAWVVYDKHTKQIVTILKPGIGV
jgi:Na+/H+-translocating membrane pyrophosphatase